MTAAEVYRLFKDDETTNDLEVVLDAMRELPYRIEIKGDKDRHTFTWRIRMVAKDGSNVKSCEDTLVFALQKVLDEAMSLETEMAEVG
jgi:hypothetical protein